MCGNGRFMRCLLCHYLLVLKRMMGEIKFPLALQKNPSACQYADGEMKSAQNRGQWDYVEEEMKQLVAACREKGVTSKVIFENCFLTNDEKRRLCQVALRQRPDFIKTSTGFGTGGATLEDVALMKSCVGDELLIKAAGGVRTAEDALQMIEAGASRIGTSAGVEIVKGLEG